MAGSDHKAGDRARAAGLAFVAGMLGAPALPAAATAQTPVFDAEQALALSQAAIGRQVGEYTFRDRQGRRVSLAAFRGKPLVISLVYTSCATVCSMATRHLSRAVAVAQEALGEGSFNVVTIGFDAARDTPAAMARFAREQGIDDPRWRFLSADAATVAALARDLGFAYQASPRGFDHVLQATVIAADGRVHTQVYGDLVSVPQLVEPLKQLVLGVRPEDGWITGLGKRVRLFCTTYDPASGRYRFDYSLFIGMAIGGLIVGGTAYYLIRESVRARASSRHRAGTGERRFN